MKVSAGVIECLVCLRSLLYPPPPTRHQMNRVLQICSIGRSIPEVVRAIGNSKDVNTAAMFDDVRQID